MAGVLLPALPTWTGAAQAQISLSGAINYAGWFRALSQRLAKNYFLSAAKVESKVVQAQLSSDTADFRQALLTLKAAPVFTPAIRNELELADALPDGRLSVFKDCGHAPQLSRPADCAALIAAFATEATAASATTAADH